MKKALGTISLLFLLAFTSSARATLIDRGNGLVYDTIQNISWTKQADISGLNNWQGQINFATNLVFGSYDDFRLATIFELDNLAFLQLLHPFDPPPGVPPFTGNQGPFLNIPRFVWSST